MFGDDCPRLIATACDFARKMVRAGDDLAEMERLGKTLAKDTAEALEKTVLDENRNKE